MAEVILQATGVSKTYAARRGSEAVRALEPIDVSVAEGVGLGIVGESGAGKSTLLNILLGLQSSDTGSVTYRGAPVVAGPARSAEMRRFRGDVQVVFQDPRGSLNPRMTVRSIVGEPLRSLRVPGDHDARVAEVLAAVGLDPDSLRRYPHEFSGGQRQRIAIARALAPSPRVIFGDELLSALDVSVRQQILELLGDLRVELGLSLVLVSHDLAVVGQLCEEVIILQHGSVVERGATRDIFRNPQHDYTKELLAAVPSLEGFTA